MAILKDTTFTGNIGESGGNYTATFYAFAGTASSAKYADLAEKYKADKEYEVGTVVILGGTEEITESRSPNDFRVMGVVSDRPAYTMNSDLEGGTIVALRGRIRCKVIGKVRKGDLLVTSSIAGVAEADLMASATTLVGKAIEEYDGDEVGTIEILV